MTIPKELGSATDITATAIGQGRVLATPLGDGFGRPDRRRGRTRADVVVDPPFVPTPSPSR